MSNIDVSKTPTFELIDQMSYLEKEIYLKTIKYNLLSQELIRRFPFLEKDETFREKEVITKNIPIK